MTVAAGRQSVRQSVVHTAGLVTVVLRDQSPATVYQITRKRRPVAAAAVAAAIFGSPSRGHNSGRDMLLNRRLRLGGGLLALGVVALFAAHPPPVRGGSSHNLENHQYKDSRKCLLHLTARTLGCSGSGGGGGGGGNGVKRTIVTTIKRRPDKRQRGGNEDDDNDLDQNNNNFDYNYDDDDGGGGDGGDGGNTRQMFYESPLITDPRDRMLPVIYNPRPMFAPPRHQQQQPQQQQQPYNRYDDQGVAPISPFEMPIIIGECVRHGHVRFRFVESALAQTRFFAALVSISILPANYHRPHSSVSVFGAKRTRFRKQPMHGSRVICLTRVSGGGGV